MNPLVIFRSQFICLPTPQYLRVKCQKLSYIRLGFCKDLSKCIYGAYYSVLIIKANFVHFKIFQNTIFIKGPIIVTSRDEVNFTHLFFFLYIILCIFSYVTKCLYNIWLVMCAWFLRIGIFQLFSYSCTFMLLPISCYCNTTINIPMNKSLTCLSLIL